MSVDQAYTLGLDSLAQDGVPRGALTKYHYVSVRAYPGTHHNIANHE